MNLKVISRNVGFALLASAFFMFLSILVSISNGNGIDNQLHDYLHSGNISLHFRT